jgi:hypothetical protein
VNKPRATQSKLSFGSVTKKTNDRSSNERGSEISLILFEEVDVVFEDEDRGFFSALAELMQITKRPIILTCNSTQLLFFVLSLMDNLSHTHT